MFSKFSDVNQGYIHQDPVPRKYQDTQHYDPTLHEKLDQESFDSIYIISDFYKGILEFNFDDRKTDEGSDVSDFNTTEWFHDTK
jgi:hypothetical protein